MELHFDLFTKLIKDVCTVPMNTVTLSVVLILAIALRIFQNSLKEFKDKHYPRGPFGLPIVGHLPFLRNVSPYTFEKWRLSYGDVFSIRLGVWNTVVVNGYKAVKEATEKPDDDFSGRPCFITQHLTSIVRGSQSLAFGPFNEKYLEKRKQTVSALRVLTTSLVKSTEEIIIGEANILVDTLLSRNSKKTTSPRTDIQYTVCSIIYQLLYGTGVHIESKDKLNTIINDTDKFVELNRNGSTFDVMPWLRYVIPRQLERVIKAISTCDEGINEKIDEHIETFLRENIRDVTDALLATKTGGSDVGERDLRLLKSHLLSILVDIQGSGFETTSVTLQWLFLYMAGYPDVQRRVQKEINSVVGSSRPVRLQDRSDLVYTEATILEVLRIATTVPFGIPRYTVRDTKLAGYDIDRGTVVFLNYHSVMHDADFWGDPESFRPSRLLTETNQLDMSKCCRILSFGLGRRKCVGEYLAKTELFLLFAIIMHRCTIEKPRGQELDFQPVPGLVSCPKNFRVIVREN